MDVLRTAGIRKRKEGVAASTREDRGAAESAFSEYPQMLSAIGNSENALARRFSAGRIVPLLSGRREYRERRLSTRGNTIRSTACHGIIARHLLRSRHSAAAPGAVYLSLDYLRVTNSQLARGAPDGEYIDEASLLCQENDPATLQVVQAKLCLKDTRKVAGVKRSVNTQGVIVLRRSRKSQLLHRLSGRQPALRPVPAWDPESPLCRRH